jgi:hypothetical protein
MIAVSAFYPPLLKLSTHAMVSARNGAAAEWFGISNLQGSFEQVFNCASVPVHSNSVAAAEPTLLCESRQSGHISNHRYPTVQRANMGAVVNPNGRARSWDDRALLQK